MQDIVHLDGTLFLALSCPGGAVLVHPRRCAVSKHMGFVSSSAEDTLTTTNSLLDLLEESSTTATLVRHRNMLCIKVNLVTKSYLHSFPTTCSPKLLNLLNLHFEANNYHPVAHLSSSDSFSLSPFLRFAPGLLFKNKFWIDVSPLMQLKLDVHMAPNLSESASVSMIVSPSTTKIERDVHYLKGPLLGEGTYGQVFEYYDSGTLEPKALKILRKTASDQEPGSFFKTILCEITGLSLCSSYDLRIVDPYTIQLIMPMHGKLTLDKSFSKQRMFLSSGGPLFSPEDLLGVYRGLASSLTEMHSRGMAHLDIKMCNIMGPRKDFSARLIDFGLCSLQEGPQSEVLKITLDTRDPVVFSGKECFTWSDIWSIGVIFSDLVSEKRFSIIPYYQPGFWPDGRKFDWTKEETKLSLKFIEERVNDHEFLEPFLHTLDIPQEKLSVGTAYIISGSLWKNPGKRSSFGFHTKGTPGLEKWPFPVFSFLPYPSPVDAGFKFPVKEKHRGHTLLDGSTFLSTNEIPDLPEIPHAIAPKRRFQLQFIASLLSDLREFNVKTFLLSVDLLDRVSSTKVRETIEFENSCMNLIALETACVYFALLQSCAWEPTLRVVLDRALENLPWKYSLSEQPTNPLPRMWDLFLSLLSTVKFKQSWDNSLWNIIVSRQKHKNPSFVRGLLEGLLTWPNGLTTSSEFIEGLSATSSSFLPALAVKKMSFPQWITPEFNLLISASPFLDVFVHVTPLEEGKRKEESLEKISCRKYLESFKSTRTHPFWIPLPPLANLSRQDFAMEVETYIKDVTKLVPLGAYEGKQCIVCLEASSSKCQSCELWSLCHGCSAAWKGRCSQCLFPEEVEGWKTKTFFK